MPSQNDQVEYLRAQLAHRDAQLALVRSECDTHFAQEETSIIRSRSLPTARRIHSKQPMEHLDSRTGHSRSIASPKIWTSELQQRPCLWMQLSLAQLEASCLHLGFFAYIVFGSFLLTVGASIRRKSRRLGAIGPRVSKKKRKIFLREDLRWGWGSRLVVFHGLQRVKKRGKATTRIHPTRRDPSHSMKAIVPRLLLSIFPVRH